jgi:hypothetical protein
MKIKRRIFFLAAALAGLTCRKEIIVFEFGPAISAATSAGKAYLTRIRGVR